ncbi:transcription factor Jun-like [Mercenaria mercenaria]|uniref:transcription factor Jun-like n=1 Tax=Mercenaria mercenaria TaxID=6596 RepID=UPI00234F9977|nr:transcription factor Jun-like [Mercenaria mercenaria]
METTMYNDDGAGRENTTFGNKLNSMKRSMTLDFNAGNGISSAKKQKIQTALLQSPDLNMLKLASPELEKMIIQANGMVTTTPTPTQILFPKFVTDEQEAYAQGFVAALAELHSKPEGEENFENPTSSSINDALKNIFTTTTSLPGGIVPTSSLPSKSLLNPVTYPMVTVKEEPQTVPCGLNSPPPSPINMENQEVIKLERKRARNRVAARKCRTRKLERIARLEDKVADLKGQNNDLSSQASKLRDEVCKLKQTIIEHVNSGCQIMMSQNINF